MINPRKFQDDCRIAGLEWTKLRDEPGEQIPRTETELVRIYITSGGMILTLYDEEPPRTLTLTPGMELEIPSGIECDSTAGDEGCVFMVAWDPKEVAALHAKDVEQV